MRKSNAQRELEMTQAWLDEYAEKLEGIPGETIGQKIDYLLGLQRIVPDTKPFPEGLNLDEVLE